VNFLYLHIISNSVKATVYVVFIYTKQKWSFLPEQIQTINVNIDVETVHLPFKVLSSITHTISKEELVNSMKY
jgi:hypothetical protein